MPKHDTLIQPDIEAAPLQEVDPREAFIQHVRRIERHGDALAPLKSLHLPSALKAGAAGGAVVGAVTAEAIVTKLANLSSYEFSFNPIVNAAGLTLAALAASSRVARRRAIRIGTKRYRGEGAPEATGQLYELYKPKKGAVEARYYGAKGPNAHEIGDALDNLAYMARLAKSAGIKKLSVGADFATRMGLTAGEPTGTMAALLRRTGLRVGGRARRDLIHTKTPAEWLALVRQERLAHGTSLESLLAQIEQISSDLGRSHPLTRINEDHKVSDAETRHAALLRGAISLVERQLDTTESGRRIATDLPSATSVQGKVGKSGRVQQMRYTEDSITLDATNLDRALGMTDADRQHAIENAGSNPNAAIHALEAMVYKTLVELAEPPDGDTDTYDIIQDTAVPYQAELLRLEKPPRGERTTLRARRAQRMAAFAALAAVMGGTTGAAVGVTDDVYWHRVREARQAMLDAADGVAVLSDSESEAAKSRIPGALQPYGHVSDILLAVQGTLDHGPFEQDYSNYQYNPPKHYNVSPDYEPATSQKTLVGDVQPATNYSQWKLSANGMSTAGYWVTTVNNKLFLYTAEDSSVHSQWSHDDDFDLGDQVIDLPTELPDGAQQYIAVTRLLGPNDFLNQEDYEQKRIYIPVLEGTWPIAAELNGQPLQLVQRQDGTFYLLMKAGDAVDTNVDGVLKYWVAPNGDGATPRYLGRSYGVETLSYVTNDREALDAAWEELIPDLPRDDDTYATAMRRTQMIEEYIRTQWRYALQPWKDGAMDGTGTTAEQALQAARIAAANCNIAANLLALENREFTTTATGYMNTGDENLSRNDAHMWVVDTLGKRHDPTPTQGISPEDAAYFAENYDTRSVPDTGSPNQPWTVAYLFMVAAGIAAWRRRDLVRGAKAVAGDIAAADEKHLRKLTADDIRLAYELLQQARQIPDRISVDAARRSASPDHDWARPKSDRVRALLQTAAATPAARKALAAAMRGENDPERAKALRLAVKATRRAARAVRAKKLSER